MKLRWSNSGFILFFWILLDVFLLASCSNDVSLDRDPQLPAITMTGENTFGCLVNGELWLPKGNGGVFDLNPDAKYNEVTKGLQIKASNENEVMHVYIEPSEIGEYEFNYIQGWTYSDSANPDCRFYYLDTSRYNFVNISKLDKGNDIVSGTFDFVVIDSSCQDTLHFSEGRFDINYHL